MVVVVFTLGTLPTKSTVSVDRWLSGRKGGWGQALG